MVTKKRYKQLKTMAKFYGNISLLYKYNNCFKTFKARMLKDYGLRIK